MIDFLSDKNYYYFIFEYCPNGDLFDYLMNKGHLDESEAKPIFRQILEAVQYIHSNRVAHRNLKVESILIDESWQFKITNFILANFVDRNNLVKTPCGSPCYASPECISGQPYNGFTSDVWSCGVILFVMLTGSFPWTKRKQAELFTQIRNGRFTIPSKLSPEAQNIIKKLMTVNPIERYTIEDALSDPWLS